MRPHDIAILLKIAAMGDKPWQLVSLSQTLFISLSEVSESLNRSMIAGLLDNTKKKINRLNLLEFLEYGFKYVFPGKPEGMVRGLPTALTHPFMKAHFASDVNYVWPDAAGEMIGLSIEGLYPKQPEAAANDPEFYKLLALVDVIRIGRVREIRLAISELKKIILNEPS